MEGLKKAHHQAEQTTSKKELFTSKTNAEFLAMVNPALPRSSKVAKEIDKRSTIMPTPGKVIGVQQSLLKQLEKVVEWLLRANPTLFPDNNIQINLLGMALELVAVPLHCYSVHYLNKEALPLSPGGNHTVAILMKLKITTH